MSNDVEKWVSIERDEQGFVMLSFPKHNNAPIGPMPVKEAEMLAALINAREAALLRGATRTEFVVKFAHTPTFASAKDIAESVRKALEESAAQGVRMPVRVEIDRT